MIRLRIAQPLIHMYIPLRPTRDDHQARTHVAPRHLRVSSKDNIYLPRAKSIHTCYIGPIVSYAIDTPLVLLPTLEVLCHRV